MGSIVPLVSRCDHTLNATTKTRRHEEILVLASRRGRSFRVTLPLCFSCHAAITPLSATTKTRRHEEILVLASRCGRSFRVTLPLRFSCHAAIASRTSTQKPQNTQSLFFAVRQRQRFSAGSSSSASIVVPRASGGRIARCRETPRSSGSGRSCARSSRRAGRA